MPRGEQPATISRREMRRALTIGATAVVVLVVAWIVLFSGSGYTVTARFENGSQLVKGNIVRIGGIRVGTVKSIDLAPDNQADVKLELDADGFVPLHEGTFATVRYPSIASIAARSVDLAPGPKTAPEIPDGAVIPAEHTRPAVDADEIFDALDLTTTRRARRVLTKLRTALEGRGGELNDALRLLEPALSATSASAAEVVRDEPALKALVSRGSDLVSTLADRSASLESGTQAANTVATTLAEQREALARTLERSPGLLRATSSTSVDLRGLLTDVRPAIAEARPVARRLSALLPVLRPTATGLHRVAPRLRQLIRRPGARNDLYEFFTALPGLNSKGTPVVRDLVPTLDDLLPIVDELRPYLPDLTGGLVNGFGGSPCCYYDANGDYARIQFAGGPFSATDLLAQPAPSSDPTAVRTGLLHRCPGAAAPVPPDRSTPFLDKGQVSCDKDGGG